MDVTFDRANHHLAHARRAGFNQQGFQDGHAAFHCIGGKQYFRHKQNAVAEVIAHDGHAAHQSLGQNAVRLPFAFQQNVNAFFDLFFQAIVEIVKHLSDEIFVIQVGKDDIVFLVRHWPAPSCVAYLHPYAVGGSFWSSPIATTSPPLPTFCKMLPVCRG